MHDSTIERLGIVMLEMFGEDAAKVVHDTLVQHKIAAEKVSEGGIA